LGIPAQDIAALVIGKLSLGKGYSSCPVLFHITRFKNFNEDQRFPLGDITFKLRET
jgi:hypothetical protein